MGGRVVLLVGALAAGAAVIAALSPVPRWRSVRVARALLVLAAVALTVALVQLAVALVTGDYALVYVADHTRRGASAWYRLAGLWGGMEGSLLLWTALLLAAVAALGGWRQTRRRQDDEASRHAASSDIAIPTRGVGEILRPCVAGASPPWTSGCSTPATMAAWRLSRPDVTTATGSVRTDAGTRVTIAVLGALVAGFALATAFTADPFRTLQIPATDGGGLVPILEHPAMLVHPPLLYAGLVSTVVVFAATVGALLTGGLDDRWRRLARRWLLLPWILLVLGLVTGANWAYVELGWGGYWAWDPIENTALLPWLAATAALHQLLVAPSRRGTTVAAGVLALLPWVLAALGTLLTRSGAAVSVHAFAESDAVAIALGSIWLAVVALAAVAIVVGARRERTTVALDADEPAPPGPGLDRSTLLRAQNVLVLVAVALIAAGTVTPVVRSLLGGPTGVTTGDFFATWTAPLVWAALLLMAVAPARDRHQRVGWSELERLLRVPVLAGLAIAALCALQGWTSPRTLVTAALAGTAAAASVLRLVGLRRGGPGRLGSHLAHLGFAVLLLGLAGATAGSDRTATLATGDAVDVGGVVVVNRGVRTDPGVDGNPRIIATFDVDRGGRQRVLEPEIVGYPAVGERLAESALWSDPTGDVQLVLRSADDDGRALVDIHVRPLTPLVWWGALLLALGGIVAAATPRRSAASIAPDAPRDVHAPPQPSIRPERS